MDESRSLRRALNFLAVVAIGLTSEIASGLFFLTSQIQTSAVGVGSLVPLLMIIGGVITVLTVVVYRFFMSQGFVGPGGEYVMISGSLGKGIAFVGTFLTWFSLTAVMGLLAYLSPGFISNAFASVNATGAAHWFSTSTGTIVTGLVLIWGFWAIHVFGVKWAGLFAKVAMWLVVAASALIIIYGFFFSPSDLTAALSHKGLDVSAIIAQSQSHTTKVGVAFMTALPALFFGYLGLSNATQTGGEAKNAHVTLPKAILVTAILVTIIYTVFAFAVYHAIPWQLISGLAVTKHASLTTVPALLGLLMPHWLAATLNFAVALIVIKSLIPILLAQSRWLYAWANDGIIPAVFARTSPRYGTPTLSLFISALLASLSLIESVQAGFVFGVGERVLSVMIVFILLGVGMMVLRNRETGSSTLEGTSYLAKNAVGRRAVGAVLVIISLWFTYGLIQSSIKSALYLQPVFQAVIVLLVGVVIYFLPKGNRVQVTPARDEEFGV